MLFLVLLRLSKLALKPRFFSNIESVVLGSLLAVSFFFGFRNGAALMSSAVNVRPNSRPQ